MKWFHLDEAECLRIEKEMSERRKNWPEDQFLECESCYNKSGTPTLCTSCLHNRRLIYRLQEHVRRTI